MKTDGNMHRDYCSPESLHATLIETGSKVVILDFRNTPEFDASHVSGAVSVQITLALRRQFQKDVNVLAAMIAPALGDKRESVERQLREAQIVLYDQTSESLESLTSRSGSSLPLVFKKLRESGSDVRLLKGGFVAFCERFPEACQGSQSKVSTHGQPSNEPVTGLRNLHISSNLGDQQSSTPFVGSAYSQSPPHYDATGFPVKVLPFLFLGNAENAHDWQCLQDHNISHILNVTKDISNRFDSHLNYLQLPIEDKCSEDLLIHFDKAINFIDGAKDKGDGILVHCLAGVSRSVTIVIAYLMKSESITLDEAFDFVRRKKTNISPNFTFMGQLKDFEASLGLTVPQPGAQTEASPPTPKHPEDNCSQDRLSSSDATSGEDTLYPSAPGGHTGAFSCTPSSGTSSSSSANDSGTQKFSYQLFDKASKLS